MVTGWRRAFCTSIPKEREAAAATTPADNPKQRQSHQQNCSSQSPRFSSKFGLFSNSSTSRLQSQPVSSPSSLRCKTSHNTTPSSIATSPKLHCKTSSGACPNKKPSSSPLLSSLFPNHSSPKSPSTFSVLKASLRLSKSRCGICLQSVKTGQGTAIFTAECSHSFHFPCIANHIQKNNHHLLLTCPLCSSPWKQVPVLSSQNTTTKDKDKDKDKDKEPAKSFKVYNDDEPLGSPISLSHFNPIPESDEDQEEFQGVFATTCAKSNLELGLLPESAVVAVGRNYETYAIVLKIRAPLFVAMGGLRRAPVDLVTLVDVSLSMGGSKLQMMKRALKLVVSSLSCSDRLSIVAFSNASKRLLPLRRMTNNGRRSARKIIDALGITGQGMSANDALKKAAKVLEDRRERNLFASVLILSETNSPSHGLVSSTRLPASEIPVHSVALNVDGAIAHAPTGEAFVKCVNGLLSPVVQDLKLHLGFASGSAPAEIAAVYSLTGRAAALGSGSIRLGDLYGDEERDLLIELKVPASSTGAHHVLSVRSSYKDPSSRELICSKDQAMLAPRPQAVRASSPSSSIARLRNLHVSTRAVAESRRLMEVNDFSGAYHLLSSARALLVQRSSSNSAEELLRGLEGELVELHRRRQQQVQGSQGQQRQRVRGGGGQAEEKPEPLTPTSAWRAAERLAKVAIMRKQMNRVSDLHGFENARF